jgi:pyruvate,water dikinase
MEAYIIAPYCRLGCRIPDDVSSVRIFHGRPYLNVTLFHDLVAQLRGDSSLLAEQMGGDAPIMQPAARPLGWIALVHAGIRMMGEMRKAVACGPRWFAEMKQLAATYQPRYVVTLSFEEIAARLDELERWLDRHEITFGIAGGAAHCLQALSTLLPRWLGPEWRALVNASLQGEGTIMSAQQIVRLAELAQIARQEPTVSRLMAAEPWNPTGILRRLEGTSFLQAFDRYLEDYGHRGVGESDVMSPRFADQPETLLTVLRTQLRAGTGSSPAEILARQQTLRKEALTAIRRRFGWRLHRWTIFFWWHRRLCRFSALREANRHHLMYYSSAVRNLLLRLGELLVARGLFRSRDDIFYLTLDERAALVAGQPRDWSALVQTRRAERERNAAIQVPDTIRGWDEAGSEPAAPAGWSVEKLLRGTPISAGSARGPVRLIRSMADWSRVKAGDILVAPVIDPGLAPLFGIAAGLIVEMGGTLSHGAIMAREYGLPTVANVPRAMSLLKDGEPVEVRAASGDVRRLGFGA